MKKRKLILSSAALLITIGSNLAFKVVKKVSTRAAYIQEMNACHQCIDAWTGVNPDVTKCRTHANGLFHLGAGTGHFTFYTRQDPSNPNLCINPTHATIAQ